MKYHPINHNSSYQNQSSSFLSLVFNYRKILLISALTVVLVIFLLNLSENGKEISKHPLFASTPPSTIFISVSVFRDPLCSRTLASIFHAATFPRRIYIGIVEQFKPGDTRCLEDWEEKFPQHKQYKDQIAYKSMDADDALGPTYARAIIANELFGGQDYFLQIDSHTAFLPGWDVSIIEMHEKIPENHLGVLSYYPQTMVKNDTEGAIYSKDFIDKKQKHTTEFEYFWDYQFGLTTGGNKAWESLTSVPQMCEVKYKEVKKEDTFPAADNIQILSYEIGLHDILRKHIKRGVLIPASSPIASAGFLFMPKNILLACPYDASLKHLFIGEEILYSSRLWTRGFNFYNPTENLAFHFYIRTGYPKFWESPKYVYDVAMASQKRVNKIIQLVQKQAKEDKKEEEEEEEEEAEEVKSDTNPIEKLRRKKRENRKNNSSEEDVYGLGTVRTLAEYYEFLGITGDSRQDFCKYH